jgi:hypothetical protein
MGSDAVAETSSKSDATTSVNVWITFSSKYSMGNLKGTREASLLLIPPLFGSSSIYKNIIDVL